MKRALLAIVCLAWLAPAMPAHAQQSATLVLRSGERISGELVDLGGVGFTIRVNGTERRVPNNDVAVVEFAGDAQLPSDMQAKLSSGQQLVRLTNGQIIEGRLSDISGTKPLKLTVDTPSGQRDFSSTDVAQVYLGPPPSAPGAAAPAVVATTGQARGTVQVQANQAWTDTGITVKKGNRLSFQSSGQIRIASGAAGEAAAGPDGTANFQGQNRAKYPVPVMPVGGLIGRVGNSRPFPIGANSQPITMPADGKLYLGINDEEFSDNSGAFSVTISR